MAVPVPTQADTIEYTVEIPYQFTSTSSVADFIIAEAMKYHYPPQKAVAVAWCESNLIPTAKSKISSASGLFQFIKSTWQGTLTEMGEDPTTSPFDPEMNIKAGLFLISKPNGEKHWSESEPCWSKLYNKM